MVCAVVEKVDKGDQNKLEEAELLCKRASERREETQSQTLTSSENLPSPVVVTSGELETAANI